jgi:hypothetical protein
MNDVQYGWVVEASQARGGGPGQGVFISDERPVGLSDLQKARWFTDQDDARRAAYWQLGTVLSATRINGKITV